MNLIIRHMALPAVFGLLSAAAFASCGSDGDGEPALPGPSAGSEAVASVNTDVIYQANPRFFAKTRSLSEIESQLPRISGMGCDVLWLMPIMEPGEERSIGSPYCIKDYKKINPAYGTDADLHSLVTEIHRLGMRVILDWVPNHTSFDNPWTVTNPERYKKDAAGNIVSPNADWKDVAQLDYSSRSTVDAMIDAMEYWVKEFHIDGYRCDYTEGVPHEFWKEALADLRRLDPEMILLAETSSKDFYADGFDMVYDWDFAPAMAKAFGQGRISAFVTDARATIASLPADKSILRYAFNHDVASEHEFDRYFGSADGVKAAYVLTAMLGGTPMIYSGMDAEGVSGKLSFFDYSPLTFSDRLTADYTAIDDAYKSTAGVRGGSFADYSTGDVAAFTYRTGAETLLVVVNTAGDTRSYRTPIQLTGEPFTELIDGSSAPLPVSLQLAPYGYNVYLKK